MQTKLTLRLEKNLVESAKAYANSQGKSVSKIVADYFTLLEENSTEIEERIGPIAQSLKGSLGKSKLDESDYKKHLEEKYL